jgi:hypothetical protein
MKNANEVLQQKEAELARVRHEIESLKIVVPLLSDEDLSSDDPDLSSDNLTEKLLTDIEETICSMPTGTDGMFSSISSRPRFWKLLVHGR